MGHAVYDMTTRDRLCKLFCDTQSLKKAPTGGPLFKLSGGGESPYYVNCRRLLGDSAGVGHACRAMYASIRYGLPEGTSNFYVGGTGNAGNRLVGGILNHAFHHMTSCQGFHVLDQAKTYGVKEQLTGIIGVEGPIFMVEDVITTGGSIARAAHTVLDQGFRIHSIHALVDRGEGGVKALEDSLGVPVLTMLTMSELFAFMEEYTGKR